MRPRPGTFGDVFEELAVFVPVERRPVAGEIGLGDIEEAVAVVVRDRDAHARLQTSVGIVGDAGRVAALFERSVVLVAIEQAGGLVAGDIDVGPAVVIEIGDDHAQAVAAAGRQNAGLFGDVGERAVAVVVVERVVRRGQSARAADDHHALPFAILAAAGLRGLIQIEVHVVGDENIEVAVAIVIDKRAARAPARAGDRQAGRAR